MRRRNMSVVSRRLSRTSVHTSYSQSQLHNASSSSDGDFTSNHHLSSATASTTSMNDHSTPPAREDCWTEEATFALIDAWGDHYVKLNRRSLSRKHWQQVANAVNSRLHGHINKKSRRRTDVQCINRIDTLKKRYKTEKSNYTSSSSSSSWPFFHRLDSLIGTSPSPSPAPVNLTAFLSPTLSFPVGRRSKRTSVGTLSSSVPTNSQSWQNLSRISLLREMEVNCSTLKAYEELAESISRFGEVYERVEEEKCRKMFELEKERMQFAKELEIERLKLFTQFQLLLRKTKASKHTPKLDAYRRSLGEQSSS